MTVDWRLFGEYLQHNHVHSWLRVPHSSAIILPSNTHNPLGIRDMLLPSHGPILHTLNFFLGRLEMHLMELV